MLPLCFAVCTSTRARRSFLGPALRVARYSAAKQHADGSWDYGEAPSQRWIDNFHTGYNLCALQQIDRYLETDEFEACIRRGFDFYKAHFFREDGAARYFHNRTYPIDIHCVAQSIITLLAFEDLDPGYVPSGAFGVPMGDESHVGRSGLLLLSGPSVWDHSDLVYEMVSGVDAVWPCRRSCAILTDGNGIHSRSERQVAPDTMIEVIFTLDYEIYGNGTGALNDLVYEPAARLMDVFRGWNARFVAFVEAAEFEQIETHRTDPAIGLVKRQIREFYKDDFEVALHLHPQWYGARYDCGRWILDYREYNLCALPRERIVHVVDRSIGYLRRVLDEPGFTPLSFRAGNWLFQPTRNAAEVLFWKGIKIDSSVFKGGVQRAHRLDYRRALKNGYYWSFASDVNVPDPDGPWMEIPVYAEMVPFWRMLTAKRVGLQTKGATARRDAKIRLGRLRDYMRLRYPRKFDFCRMTLEELTSTMDRIIQEDREEPWSLRPIVAIGHTKDLTDVETINSFLSFLRENQVTVATFAEIYPRLSRLVTAKANAQQGYRVEEAVD